MVLCDIGARGGIADHWLTLRDFIRVVAFEPDKDQAEKLTDVFDLQGVSARIIDKAVWEKEDRLYFYFTRSPASSSLLKPNFSLLSNFTLKEKFELTGETSVEVDTLDKFLADERENINFLKIDTQGTSFNILKGAQSSLADVFGIEVEAEFSPVYENESLFPDIDSFLQKRDYVLVDLRPTYWRRADSEDIAGTKGQLMYADLVYLMDPEKLAAKLGEAASEDAKRELLLKAVTCCASYNLRDWMINYLAAAQPHFGSGTFDEAMNLIRRGDSLLSRVPDFRYRIFLGNILKDIGDLLHNRSTSIINRDPSIGNLKRHS